MRQAACFFLVVFLAFGMGLWMEAQQVGRAGDTSVMEADFTVLGEYSNANNGNGFAIGDVNGDGLGDLVYGVPFANPNQLFAAGEVHIFFAKRTRNGQEVMKIQSFSSLPDVVVSGEAKANRLGTSVAVGDVNGDGIQDVIMGAGGYTPTGRSDGGAVFVLFGRTNWPAFVVLRAQRADIQVVGAHYTDKLGGHKAHTPNTFSGQSVGAGDLNGDGIDDLILGAPDATFTLNGISRSLAGAVYVLWGQKNWPAQYKHDLLTTPASVNIFAAHNSAHLGGCVTSGDFNGDGVQDLVIGEAEGNTSGGSGAGNTYVFWGRYNWPPNVVVDLGFGQQADVRIMGDDQWDQSGYSVDLGDFDGDKIDDMIIGAWRHDPINKTRDLGGKVYVFYGKKNFPPNHVINLDLTIGDLNFIGASSYDWLGYRVRAGDVDGDGFDDMIMSAPSRSPNFRNRAGTTYMFRGGQTLPPYYTVDLQNMSVDWRIHGGVAEEYLGQTLGVGDINGDGHADIVQGGDITAFNNATQYAGRVVVTYGGPMFATSPAKIGQQQWFKLYCPIAPNEFYICAASAGLAGCVGIPISPTRTIPIDLGPLLIVSFQSQPPFGGFFGNLDGAGTSTSPYVFLPNMGALVGFNVYYTMVVQNATSPQSLKVVGNRVHTTIIP